MKFNIKCCHSDTPDNWWVEEYDKNDVTDAQDWSEKLITNFNATLRSGEKHRTLLGVEVIEENTRPDHEWEKTNMVTQRDPKTGQLYDTMRCKTCEITARRYGFSRIVRDPEYRAKAFERCDTALKRLEKLRGKNA